MEKRVKITLDSIAYKGDNIGRDLTFSIIPGPFTDTNFKKRIANGDTLSDLNRTVLKALTDEQNEFKVPFTVKIVEQDKFSDFGAAMQEVTIDLNKTGAQEFTIDVTVEAIGGDRGKVAVFTLKFTAMLVVPILVKGEVLVNANSKSSARAGVNDMGKTASKEKVKSAKGHAAQYDGPTVFKAQYEIVTIDGELDKANSKVRFVTISFTQNGGKVNFDFTTTDIPITSVKFIDGDVTKIASFQCATNNWYPNDADGAPDLKDRDLVGTVDLINGKTRYVASYTDRRTGAVYIYTVNGRFRVPNPIGPFFMGAGIFAPM
ncbi:hypothetical protein POV27_03605 [Aureisphaera galaxeae]|uniref:hypothetical protein n=1 Tax=Aureisphaera galaxeae TaxID=1538023 RepID=UPI00234FC7B1|nr:hypothetical protein [Aureisphaera galaxeae]MDC8003120.1 hypothetical protein [Aureisphaera galaxeae]